MQGMKLALTSALALAAASLPLVAQDRFDPVEARVLTGWVTPDGTRMVALDLQLAPGWKTYWRAPGDGGIPPSFDWSRSRNLETVEITWPAPAVFDQNGMRSYGYEDRLILPLELTPRRAGQDIDLRVEMDMGVCADVCVPYSLTLDQMLNVDNTRPTPEIAGALAQQPYSASEAGVTEVTCRLEPIADGLRLEARVRMPSAGGAEVMVIEPGLADVWVSEAETRREGENVIAQSDMIHVSGGVFAVDRSELRLTVLGRNHAVDIQGCSAG